MLGLVTRRLRAALSAVGISIGIAAIVGVIGISSSNEAALLAQLNALGTNLLSVSPGRTLGGSNSTLPHDAPLRIRRVGPVSAVAATGLVLNVTVRRSAFIPTYDTGGIAVRAAEPDLPTTVGATLRAGTFLNDATIHYPAVVLGSYAARHLGISNLANAPQVDIGGQWFGVVGILNPVPLAPTLDQSALVGFPIAESRLGFDGSYSTVYVLSDPNQTLAVENVLARTTDPAHPDQVAVSRPSDAIAAEAAAQGAYNSLFLGLGAVALLVGGVGIANVMFVSVLERRSEIGLRRALGATQVHVALQFLTESLLLSALGGIGGIVLGSVATIGDAAINHWLLVIPMQAIWGGFASACIVGVVAGLYPAMRAARLTPTEALRAA